jgi:3-hydroxyacyl-[acyl-carrier-protein] dehydratase
MQFVLTDRILELQAGKRIRTVKALSLAEEYLADHFPAYPVMPGVMMFEALVQAGAWLARATTGFAHSVIVLREARSVSYGSAVLPGDRLETEVTADEWLPDAVKLRGVGRVNGETAVKGRLTLKMYNMSGNGAASGSTDAELCRRLRQQFALLGGPAAAGASGAA